MRFLITGGAGFIGSALAQRLIELGHSVRVLDDLSTGDRSQLHPAVIFAHGDVRDVPHLWSLLRGIDVVFHLAARVVVEESVHYPIEYNAVNVGGTVSLMTAARDAGIRKVVMASSGAVYGEQEKQPIGEEATPRPQSPYAISKLAAEYYVRGLGEQDSIETVVLRIFNTYGPLQPVPPSYPTVIPRLVKSAVKGGSLVVQGSGDQTRDFVYIDDVVQALVDAAISSAASGQTLNIGSGQEISINGLVSRIEGILGHPLPQVRNLAAEEWISRARADIRRAQKILRYDPRVDIDTGLTLMIEHYRGLQPSLLKIAAVSAG